MKQKKTPDTESMSYYWKEDKKLLDERHQKNRNKYEPVLKRLGAKNTSDGVWIYKDWQCYTAKGYAMEKRTYKKVCLDKLLDKETRSADTQTAM